MSHPARQLLDLSPRPVKGFAVISALFLIVVLAALGAFMVTFSNTQQLTSAQDIQGTRAYWAARAGLEWGINRANASACAASTNLGSIETFTVTVTCSSGTYTDGSATPNVVIYRISARACSNATCTPGSVGYIERSVTASIEK